MTPVRVLIVEDDPEYSELLQRALTNAGFQCVVAPTLGAAWTYLVHDPPALVLMDQQLPDGLGETLCERVRATPEAAEVIVAFLTGDKAFAEGNDWLLAGGDTCWLKPTSAPRVAALVKGLLRRHARDSDPRKLLGAGLFLDKQDRAVIFNGRRSKKLTDREFLFVDALGKAKGGLLPRQAAHDIVFADGTPAAPEPAMNEMLRKLRSKLPPALARSIETVFGKGYRLRLPTPDDDANQPRVTRA